VPESQICEFPSEMAPLAKLERLEHLLTTIDLRCSDSEVVPKNWTG